MPIRHMLFAVLLGGAAALVSYGAALLSRPAGLIVGGVLLAGWSWAVLGE